LMICVVYFGNITSGIPNEPLTISVFMVNCIFLGNMRVVMKLTVQSSNLFAYAKG